MNQTLVKTVTTASLLFLLLLILSGLFTYQDLYGQVADAEQHELQEQPSDENVLDNNASVDDEVFSTGLEDAYIELIVPDYLPLYETLVCDIAILDAKPGFEGLLIWYLDGESVLEEWIVSDQNLPGISADFEYSRFTPEAADIKASLLYITEDGGIGEISAEESVKLGNYSKTHWMELEAERVLEKVSDRYQGNFTLQWAEYNDYDDFDKEVFVNMKGYKSNTDYLVWVNLSHQRVNVFKGSEGEWELVECFIVATGGPGRGTKRGVTTVTRKQDIWHFGSYIVRPIVRFWPGTGYAFHSRLLFPGTEALKDGSIGYPVSAGCVRMYCDDVWYIYNNIPDGTTVVVH